MTAVIHNFRDATPAEEARERRISQENAERPADPSVAAAAESRRMTSRRNLKNKIAKAKLAEHRLQEIVESIAALNARKDELANEHVVKCRPLHAQLRAIEDRQIVLIKARQPIDAEDDAGRREIVAKLEQANRDLEAAIAAEDTALGRLEEDRVAAAHEASEAIGAQQDLFSRLGNPELKLAYAVAESGWYWAETRLAAARSGRVRSGTDGFRLVTGALADAEVMAAGEACSKAREIKDAAYRAVIDE